MPLQMQREHWQFALLLLSVPLQYFIVQRMDSTENNRTYAIMEMVQEIHEFNARWFHVEPWKKWCLSLLLKVTEGPLSEPPADHDMGESPAYEVRGGQEKKVESFHVLKFREKDGYFGQSATVRDPRPPHVQFRVGQVIKHKRWGYRGVIVAWDPETLAPEDWIKERHGEDKHLRWQANYRVVFDQRDTPLSGYVPQELLELLPNTRIFHPLMDDLFEGFDGEGRYTPRPWLKTFYPKD